MTIKHNEGKMKDKWGNSEAGRTYRQKYYQAHKAHHIEVVKKWNDEHPKESRAIHNKANKTYYWRHRDAVLEKYGGKCGRCGVSDRRILCVDHVFGGGRKEARKYGGIKMMKLALDDETGKYQLLCHNCNWIKRSENQEAPGYYWADRAA